MISVRAESGKTCEAARWLQFDVVVATDVPAKFPDAWLAKLWLETGAVGGPQPGFPSARACAGQINPVDNANHFLGLNLGTLANR